MGIFTQLGDPSVEEMSAGLHAVLRVTVSLLHDLSMLWEKNCEDAFQEFRLSCVHLRREQQVLDKVGEKAEAWRFLCKISGERPFLHNQCLEVAKILMQSDDWMAEFAAHPDLRVEDLPQGIRTDFKKRLESLPLDGGHGRAAPASLGRGQDTRVQPREPPKGFKLLAQRRPVPRSQVATFRPSTVSVVVQRCTSARVLMDERSETWNGIGRGLLIYISFARGATETAAGRTAHFLLTAPLAVQSRRSSGEGSGFGLVDDGTAMPVSELCGKGHEVGLLVVPQDTLCCEVGEDNLSLDYEHVCPQAFAAALYKAFVEALRAHSRTLVGQSHGAKLPRIVCAAFHGRHCVDMISAGPCTHVFNF